MTGFLRSNRGIDSDVDDTFTIILQYDGEQKNLLVTIKTAVFTHMKEQLKFFVRGTKGTYLKVSTPHGGSSQKERSPLVGDQCLYACLASLLATLSPVARKIEC